MIEPTGIEIFGTPGPDTLERMQKIAGMGIPVIIHPHYAGGFIRQGSSTNTRPANAIGDQHGYTI